MSEILRFGDLTVRSSVVSKRILQSVEANKHSSAVYSFTGITPDTSDSFPSSFSEESNRWKTEKLTNLYFFDQTPYMFSIKLPSAVEAKVFSPIASLCDSADWDPDSKKLTIPVNFGNDLGDFEICWEWIDEEDVRHEGSFSGQVFSTKLDIYSHFKIMLEEVTERFNWINLDLLRQTTWGWEYSSDRETNLKTWLIIFQEVRESLTTQLQKLIDHHRKRLITETRMVRADQLKRISPRLEERVVEGLKDREDRRYPQDRKILDADTPENRYMKHIMISTLNQLNSVIDRIEPVERISDTFKERLSEWSEELCRLKSDRFWRGIGQFHGMRKESLILSQDPIYASIRQSWFLLNQGMEFLDKDLRGGIQNAAQLYEIWCLVKLGDLIKEAGWKVNDSRCSFEHNDDQISYDDSEPRSGSAKFVYMKEGLDKTELHLLFQPTASSVADKQMWTGMKSVPVVQKPDIVLRLFEDDTASFTWIFDAKYRVVSTEKDSFAPNDAVNQMHQYRDAILWQSQENEHYRESIGAYVLFPGDPTASNHQIDSIKTSNIGAFPLRPAGKDKTEVIHTELKGMIATLGGSVNNTAGPDALHETNDMEYNPYSYTAVRKSPKVK